MNIQVILLIAGFISLAIGSILGYFARQTVARKQAGTLEEKIQKRVTQARGEAETIIEKAQEKAREITATATKEISERRGELLRVEQLTLKREEALDRKISELERSEKIFRQRVEEFKKIKTGVEELRAQAENKIEQVAGITREEAKKEIFENVERAHDKELVAKIRQLEAEGLARFEQRAREVIAFAIQKYSAPQAQELTTSTVNLPSEDIKGRIIGKEGRNIRALERLTGVEIIIDETPDTVVISGFDAVRRQIAKLSLEKLIQDGRIQPARIEEIVSKVQEEIIKQMKDAGEAAVYDAGIVGLDPRLIQLLGRLKFRTSYGQSVLLHSLEVCHLSGALAAEIGANVAVAKKGGLLHDIGKALDHQVEGSHVEIGIRVLEKFGVEKDVINAMKSHHEEYPAETVEAVLVQSADAISAARPGARKDTVENYLRRLGELEALASSFAGVEKAWALQAGREIRIFVRPEAVDDLSLHKLARNIADRIQEELKYPGEIKVTAIRENRVVEYAK
ncbi:MAG: ribonuclease Y [Candidatus Wildermuthbacteria bacterium RIFCSPHIGHO2_01_FULL_47_27]|uniref:Ribonuclease Y n=1 Tax=Candidatus Wildermuthbacteria bacterium RIFCSPLOWO2_01_FULL_48_35 TaxID=1802463 RepID=A0A1G2RS45_9BACT|nr:MAG: ribonuclease Y [Candidatus Wildermuthbacteria bacterium RIFCSPHIGHO2_01_FULL_47_27]OHA75278.1 MAG: ribonuclease Y [Candidatus Wildermuthbacteria bacterium RIFCSPLOWO2_01_FULL_48_35]